MNEISTTMFMFISGMSVIFLIGSVLLQDKIYGLISSILSAGSFFTEGMMLLSGKIGLFYLSGGVLLFNPIQSTTLHYFYYSIAGVSLIISIYLLYQIIVEMFAVQSAFDSKNSAFGGK